MNMQTSLRAVRPGSRARITPILAALLLISGTLLTAQQAEPDTLPEPRYGGFLHLNLNMHRAGFARLPGVPNCCQEFTGGTGLGFTLGALYTFPLSEVLFLDGRLAYASLGARLVESEETTVIVNGDPTTGEFEHQLEASLGAAVFEPTIGYRISERLAIRAGGGMGYILSGSYTQQEELIRPEGTGVFENGRRVRNEFSGDIPDRASLLAYGQIGLGYDLPLNSDGTLRMTPELVYTRGFTQLVADSSWAIDGLRLGVAVTFASGPDPIPVAVIPDAPIVQEDDTVTVAEEIPPLVASVRATGLNDEGSEVSTATLRVEEFVSTNMRPLLNYVFFAEGSDSLPERYHRLSSAETGGFRVEQLYGIGTIETYHDLLNIVGRRMRENPEATMRLVGCNDGLAEGGDAGTELSGNRADRVFDYLTGRWGIDPSRLTVEARGLPATPSNREDTDGIEENRRVELYSDTWEILAPVITDDTLRVTNPPSIRFHPDAAGPAPVKSWRLTAGQSREAGLEPLILKEYSEQGSLPETLDWDLEGEQRSVPRFDEPLEYRLTVTDTLGRTVETAAQELPVEQITVSKKRRERIADKFIDRYSLILFDFDKADFTDANNRIAEFIRARINEGATVTITGYTDRIGRDEYNLNLSQRRADRTAQNLETDDADVSGVGETTELYDNDLPEGRFYSRTVTIVVETPVNLDE